MKYSTVTVYKRNGSDWDTLVFDKAFVRRIKSVKNDNGGRYINDVLTARIFSPSAARIETEDKIVEGTGAPTPPDNALTVSEIANNYAIRRGHIRVTAS